MRHCDHLQDDLALFAGGDLAGLDEERSVREHLSACEGCRGFVAELEADLVALTALPEFEAEGDDSLVADVLAGLAGSEAPAVSDRRAPAGSNLRAAAAVFVVAVALVGAFSLQDGAVPADSDPEARIASMPAQGAVSSVDGLPIRVRRTGDDLELEWTGDGREAAPAGSATTYRVVASASPDDFDAGSAVEVAGRRLVAGGAPFPARKMGDRDLTFFRVE